MTINLFTDNKYSEKQAKLEAGRLIVSCRDEFLLKPGFGKILTVCYKPTIYGIKGKIIYRFIACP